ncbi:hypothetical protein GCM10028784_30340 [Myceligenerans cantabricum]
MTYGQAAATLRSAMTHLLSGLGLDDITIAAADGTGQVEAMKRYRAEVHKYALGLMTFVHGGVTHEGRVLVERTLTEFGQVQKAGTSCTAEQLAEQQTNPLTEAWRQAAIAAVVVRERELPHLADISVEERLLLTMDATNLVNALLLADARFIRIPGWQPIGGDVLLRRVQRGKDPLRSRVYHSVAQALDECSQWARSRITAASYLVDDRGYRPGPPLHPMPGASAGPCDQAASLVQEAASRLRNEYPDAHHLALLLSTNQFLTAHGARLTKDSGPKPRADAFATRAVTYQVLAATFRANITGRRSQDVSPVSLAQRALAFLQNVPRASREQLRKLDDAFDQMDRHVATTIQRGIQEARYVTSRRKRLAHVPGGGARTHFVPVYEAITDETHPDLLRRARQMGQEKSNDWFRAKPGRVRSDSVVERLQFDALVAGRLRRSEHPAGALQPHVEILRDDASVLDTPDEWPGLEI